MAVAALIVFKPFGSKGKEGGKEEEVVEPETIEAPMLYELGDLKLPALPVLNADIVVTREDSIHDLKRRQIFFPRILNGLIA